MSGTGTGYPNWFRCAVARRRRETRGHQVSLTGRTRPTPHDGKGHPRKSWTTREYRCSCGHIGWSNHIDLEQMEWT